MGVFWVIGAVKNATIGYYKQDVKEYAENVRLNENMEITSCLGNISLKDNEIFTLSNHEVKVFEGHLMNGTEIFAAEFYIEELVTNGLVSGDLVRKEDTQTGLSLWAKE